MNNNLNEELNRLKYLLGYKPGQLMTESQVKETYLSEQSRGFRRTPEPTNTPPKMIGTPEQVRAANNAYYNQTAQPSYGTPANKESNIKFSTEQSVTINMNSYPKSFISSSEIYFLKTEQDENGKFFSRPILGYLNLAREILGTRPNTKDIINVPETRGGTTITPKSIITVVQGQSFNPNMITINRQVTNSIRENAKNIVDTLLEIYKLRPETALSNIKKFLNKGFNLRGHADGSIPMETNINNTDHANFGNGQLYGGNTTPNSRNRWLAEQRARNAYSIFMDELTKQLNKNFKRIPEIIETVTKIFTIGGGFTTLNIQDHLNSDGTANTREQGAQFRRFEFNPTFNSNIPIEIETVTPGRTETKIIPGTKYGKTTLNLSEDLTAMGTIEGIVHFNEVGLNTKDEWWGVKEEDLVKLPTINQGTFNGNTTFDAIVKNNIIGIDGKLIGKFSDNPNRLKDGEIARTGWFLGYDTTIGSPKNVNGVWYYPIQKYSFVILSRQ
jgi:hypothetical protein